MGFVVSFSIQERSNNLIYGIKMQHLTACKISVILSFLKLIKKIK